MTDKFNVRLLNKMKCRHIKNKPLKEILLYILTYPTHNNSNLWYRYLQVRTITRVRAQCIILYEHQRREHPKVLALTFKSLAVSLRTTRFNIQKFYMVLALR
jgi:hypothetical protein